MAETIMDKVLMVATSRSHLEITGSCGVEFTGEVMPGKPLAVGATAQAFQITDNKNNRKEWLGFVGLGAGASVGKSVLGALGISGATPQMWSNGSHIYGGTLNWGEVKLEELYSKDVLIYTGSLSAGLGGGGITLIFFAPIPLVPCPMAWHSCAVVTGMSLSSSYGVGLMQYYGFISPPVS